MVSLKMVSLDVDGLIYALSNSLIKYPRIFIPFFTYVVFTLLAWVIRRDSSILTKDFPKTGSELCKIACGLLLGSIAIGFQSDHLKNSLLSKLGSPEVTASFLIILFIVAYLFSYWPYHIIEGKRVGKDIGFVKWFGCFAISQLIEAWS